MKPVKMKNSRDRVSRRDGKIKGGDLIPRPCSLLSFLVLAMRNI